MKGGHDREAKVGPLANWCRLKVIEASKCTDYDAKGAIERIAAGLGASLYQKTTKAITHFVVAQQRQVTDGDVTVLSERIALATRACPNAFIVSQGWVHECARAQRRAPEEQYRVESENLPVVLKKCHRRCKSTVPANLDDVNLDLSAPFFSSTQALQQADCVPMARKQVLKNRRHESALANMPRQSVPASLSPATSMSKDDQVPPHNERVPYNGSHRDSAHFARKSGEFLVERLPGKRRNTLNGLPQSLTCSPAGISRPAGLRVSFQVPHNVSPGSAIKARTRNRTPSLDFMLARIGMPLPIIQDDGRALKRNDALFLAAANATRANTPRQEIPVPVVRSVEEEVAQQTCVTNRPRRRRTTVDLVQMDTSYCDVPAAKTPGEALALGVWTDQRVWDYLPEYRPPSTAMGRYPRRALAERETSPKGAATPECEISADLVVPDSTCPTEAGAEETLRASGASLLHTSRPAALQHDSDGSAQENIAAPNRCIETEHVQHESRSEELPGGLFSCLAAMGYSTRKRLSALAAVVADSPDGRGHNESVEVAPDPIPSAAAGERIEVSVAAAAGPQVARKRNIAARELGINSSREATAPTHHRNVGSSGVCRTRATSTAAPLHSDRPAGQPSTTAGPSDKKQQGTRLCVEKALDLHVPRAKRSVWEGSAVSLKRQLNESCDNRSSKRAKACGDEGIGGSGHQSRVRESSAVLNSDSDLDSKSMTACRMPKKTAQCSKTSSGKMPRTPRLRSSMKNGELLETCAQTEDLPLALRAVGINLAPSKQQQHLEGGKRSGVKAAAKSSERNGQQKHADMCVACSGVPDDVIDRCRRAVSRLGNATMIDTEEEAMKQKLTHLVLGSNKRSGKLLLALACDAVVVRPDWLVQSLRWRRWLPTENFMSEFGSHGNSAGQGSKQEVALDNLLVPFKVHVTSAAANGKKVCVRVQLFRKLVTLLGGEQASAHSCDICILVSPESQKKELSTQLTKQNSTGRAQRPNGVSRNRVNVSQLGLPSCAVVVADSWLKSTLETRKRQPYAEHRL